MLKLQYFSVVLQPRSNESGLNRKQLLSLNGPKPICPTAVIDELGGDHIVMLFPDDGLCVWLGGGTMLNPSEK